MMQNERVALALIAWAPAADAHPTDLVQQIKDATVYLKVQVGAGSESPRTLS